MRYVKLILFALIGAAVLVGPIAWYLRPTNDTPKVAPLQSAYKTEEDFLLKTVVGDVAGMTSIAAKKWDGRSRAKVSIDAGAGNVVVVSADFQGGHAKDNLVLESIWSPAQYDGIVKAMVASASVTSAESTDAANDEVLLMQLLEPKVDVLAEQDELISAQLKEQPADPHLHEQAALLLGTFALREAAGRFSDARHALCRMTAHLAFARALRGGAASSASGVYADAILATLAERETEAEHDVARLAEVPVAADVRDAWQRTLIARISDDWRQLPEPAKRSLMERLAWFRATANVLGPTTAYLKLQNAGFKSVAEPDWAWMIASQHSLEASEERERGLAATLDEARHVWSRKRKSTSSAAWRLETLNDDAEPFASTEGPEILAWGTWAAQYQRHVIHLLNASEEHLRMMLGLPDDARRFAQRAENRFSKLTLFPIIAACWAVDQDRPSRPLLESASDVLLHRPELVAAPYWAGLVTKAIQQQATRRLPAAGAWFTPACVRGTTFNIRERGVSVSSLFSVAGLAPLKAISPKSFAVNLYLLEMGGHAQVPALAEAEQAFAPRLEYDSRALGWLSKWAYVTDRAAEVRFAKRGCALDPVSCADLGGHCIELDDEACALDALERAVNESPNRLEAALYSDWLIEYHFRHGEPEQATHVMDRVSDVGSDRGLYAEALYYEHRGDYAAAERIQAEKLERYRCALSFYELAAFYYRAAKKEPSYDAKFRAATKKIFTAGLEKAPSDFGKDIPKDGAVFNGESDALRRNGMHQGTIVVACNGWRVRTFDQYGVLRALDPDPHLRLVVWNGDKYSEIVVSLPDHRFGVEMVTLGS
jgi:tetratricopeptide (TPR) repeat protein